VNKLRKLTGKMMIAQLNLISVAMGKNSKRVQNWLGEQQLRYGNQLNSVGVDSTPSSWVKFDCFTLYTGGCQAGYRVYRSWEWL